MKLHLLFQQDEASLFLYCAFFSGYGGTQQPSPLCMQCIAVRTYPEASGLKSGPAGWFCPGMELPSSCSCSGLADTGAARNSLGSGQVDSAHWLPPHPSCHVELAHPLCNSISSCSKECSSTFPSSAWLLCSASYAGLAIIFF